MAPRTTEFKTLAKGNIKRDFAPAAAKIAVELLGWTEIVPYSRPLEIGTRTKPNEITQPIKLIQPPVITPVIVSEVTSKIVPEIVKDEEKVTPVKKTRKPRKK